MPLADRELFELPDGSRVAGLDLPDWDYGERYPDDGCHLSPSCLSCWMPKCVEDVGSDRAIVAGWESGMRDPKWFFQYHGLYRDIPDDVMAEHRVPRSKVGFKGVTQPERDAILMEYSCGASATDIASRWGTALSTITKIVKGRGGW